MDQFISVDSSLLIIKSIFFLDEVKAICKGDHGLILVNINILQSLYLLPLSETNVKTYGTNSGARLQGTNTTADECITRYMQ